MDGMGYKTPFQKNDKNLKFLYIHKSPHLKTSETTCAVILPYSLDHDPGIQVP